MILQDTIHPIYKNLLALEVLKLSAVETKATCANCIMAQEAKYSANLKCCTFQPFIPNYMLGAILSSDSVDEKFKNFIALEVSERKYALPLGLIPNLTYQKLYAEYGKEKFGQKEELLCAFFDKAQRQCGIWAFRGSVCSSYFCKSDLGEPGLKFWQAWGQYFSHFEMALAEELMVQKGFNHKDLLMQNEFINQSQEKLKASKDLQPEQFNDLWQHHAGKELQYYQDCFQLVNRLNSQEVNLIDGEQGLMLRDALMKAEKQRATAQGR